MKRRQQRSPIEHSAPKRWSWPKRAYAAAMNRLERAVGLRILLVYRRRLDATGEIPEGLRDIYRLRQISRLEQDLFSRDPELRLSREFIRGASERGDICVGALHDGWLVAYRWYAVSGTAPFESGACVQCAYPAQTYGYKMFTHPRHRGRRLQLHTMIYGDTQMSWRGYTHALLYVPTHNFSSRRGLSRVRSLDLVGVTGCLRLFGHLFTIRTPGVKRFGFDVMQVDAHADGMRPAHTWK